MKILTSITECEAGLRSRKIFSDSDSDSTLSEKEDSDSNSALSAKGDSDSFKFEICDSDSALAAKSDSDSNCTLSAKGDSDSCFTQKPATPTLTPQPWCEGNEYKSSQQEKTLLIKKQIYKFQYKTHDIFIFEFSPPYIL